MLRNRALSLYPVPLADSNVPLHHAPQSGIVTIPCPSCGQQRSVASCSAIGHYHYTLFLLRTATFRCIMLRNQALSLYPVPLADSNVPLHHAPQSGIITIPCPSCGQLLLIMSFLLSDRRIRMEKSRLIDRFLRSLTLGRNDKTESLCRTWSK